jgi:hypothetical protein
VGSRWTRGSDAVAQKERGANGALVQLLKNYAKSLQKAEFRGEAQPEVRVSQRPKDQKQDVDNAVKNEIFEALGQVAVLQKNITKRPGPQ